MLESLKRSTDSAAGPDEIPYQFLKHLPESSLRCLLYIFNQVFASGKIPESWKESTIIPIPKPGKDANEPNNYRPISLTSCICKTLERMINNRLVWFLESNNILSPLQSGFRNRRGTVDHLVRLETFIREAFAKKEHLVAVFFDLEKAYDTTWQYGIMKDLHEIGVRGNLPKFISNYISDRHFKVRVGSTYSETAKQEMGVPQGGILSVTLFGLKINSITKCLGKSTEGSLFVDDFLICYRSKNMHTIERQLQQCLGKLQTWADENGFKFSRSKTVCMHFCQKRKPHNDPDLTLNGSKIPVVEQTKFLGLIFDSKLSFVPHIKHLKDKCSKAMNILRVLSHTDWGADREMLLRLYRALIRSKLDYGSIVYGSARNSYLQMLDPIHNQGLRLALGAFRTTPVQSLYVEANEPSLNDRRKKLTLQYAAQLKSNPKNPAFDLVVNPQYRNIFTQNQKLLPTFGIRISNFLHELNISLDNIGEYTVSDVPPWLVETPDINLTLHERAKSSALPEEHKSSFRECITDFPDHVQIYTDGSKDGVKVSAACYSDHHCSSIRLPDGASIFSAEACAIDLALDHIEEQRIRKAIICSDSLSVLQNLQSRDPKNILIQNLVLRISRILKKCKITLFWIPSHVGIKGNELVDRQAKLALNLQQTNIKIPYTDFKPIISSAIQSKWQQRWSLETSNKLFKVQPKLKTSKPSRKDRREEIVLSRLRTGHTYPTHSFLLKREDPPVCYACDAQFTVEHFLIECSDFKQIRDKYFRVPDMKTLFSSVDSKTIFSYLKEIDLFYRL
ncbi:Ribonuclease H [invertebrate metagenome]|uniref:Ribonuclease H n=1 Tax=invertebrate metagenome TaxID=1711999 RepID=A0A2H9T6F7_9ZZZZ